VESSDKVSPLDLKEWLQAVLQTGVMAGRGLELQKGKNTGIGNGGVNEIDHPSSRLQFLKSYLMIGAISITPSDAGTP
jgi:hypothetical protein